jgi:hypothetical protein
VFLLLGGWFLFRNKPAGPYFLTPSVVLVLFGFVAARALEIVYIAWMSLAFLWVCLEIIPSLGKT